MFAKSPPEMRLMGISEHARNFSDRQVCFLQEIGRSNEALTCDHFTKAGALLFEKPLKRSWVQVTDLRNKGEREPMIAYVRPYKVLQNEQEVAGQVM